MTLNPTRRSQLVLCHYATPTPPPPGDQSHLLGGLARSAIGTGISGEEGSCGGVKRLGTVRGCRGDVSCATGVKAAVAGVLIMIPHMIPHMLCSVGRATGSHKSFPHNCCMEQLPLGWTEVHKKMSDETRSRGSRDPDIPAKETLTYRQRRPLSRKEYPPEKETSQRAKETSQYDIPINFSLSLSLNTTFRQKRPLNTSIAEVRTSVRKGVV